MQDETKTKQIDSDNPLRFMLDAFLQRAKDTLFLLLLALLLMMIIILLAILIIELKETVTKNTFFQEQV